MTWLLCDYGEVLGQPQGAAEWAALAAVIDASPVAGSAPAFDRYWQHRPGYDRGDLSAAEYWTQVLGRPAGADLDDLVRTDVASWCYPNRDSLAGAAAAAARGFDLALLSNAPVEVADAVDVQPWLSGFVPRLFSCRLREVKPAAAAYQAVLATLDTTAGEVVFIDDRQANVDAARDLGLRAERFQPGFDWAALTL